MPFKFDFTEQKLAQIVKSPHVHDWYLAMCEILPDYEIDTVNRVACWLGQTNHESGGYKALRENLNYSADGLNKIFPKYFVKAGRDANAYARQPEKIANVVYANRMGNGDEASGDGFKYRGRGLIQLTGKNNYTAFAQSIEESVEDVPDFLETFEGAVQSACWFWESNNLNQWADKLDIMTLTKRINGGTIGLEDRIQHINHAVAVLNGGH